MAHYEFDGKRPRVAANTYVHETAQLIGNVEVGEQCFIAAGAVLRGDFGRIIVGDRSSVQESCALHCRPGAQCVVGNDVTVGHGAVLHGCTVKDRSIVGINATVSDEAVVGEDCIVAEGSVVRGGTQIPDGMLAAGVPAEVKRPLSENQKKFKDAGAKMYAELTLRYIKTARKIEE